MGLDELICVISDKEDIEIFDITNFEMYHKSDVLPLEWFEYEVTNIYSIFNESTSDSKIHIEVKPWIKKD